MTLLFFAHHSSDFYQAPYKTDDKVNRYHCSSKNEKMYNQTSFDKILRLYENTNIIIDVEITFIPRPRNKDLRI